MSDINIASLQKTNEIANNTVISFNNKIGTVFSYRSMIRTFEQSDGETFDNGMFFSIQQYRQKIAYALEGIRFNLVKLNRCSALLGIPPVLENVESMSRTGIYNSVCRYCKQIDQDDDIELWADNIEPKK